MYGLETPDGSVYLDFTGLFVVDVLLVGVFGLLKPADLRSGDKFAAASLP